MLTIFHSWVATLGKHATSMWLHIYSSLHISLWIFKDILTLDTKPYKITQGTPLHCKNDNDKARKNPLVHEDGDPKDSIITSYITTDKYVKRGNVENAFRISKKQWNKRPIKLEDMREDEETASRNDKTKEFSRLWGSQFAISHKKPDRVMGYSTF